MDIRSYRAVLYVGEQKTHGHAQIEGRNVVFIGSDTQQKLLNWDEYSISASMEGELTGVHSTLEPGKSLYVQDPKFPKELSRHLGVKVQSSFFHWWSRRPMRAALAVTAIFVLGTILTLGFLRTQGRFFAGYVTPEQEAQMGESAMASLSKEIKVIELPPTLRASWNKFLARLLDQPELKNQNWKISISDSDDANAFALPGGYLLINSGLILKSETPEEILGILAHETAHVTLRHGVQSLAGDMSAKLLASLLLGGSNIMSGLIYAADGLNSLQFSREQELEADRFGLRYLQNAGISADGMYAFFSRKDPLKPDMGSMAWLSTHPMDEDRLAQIRRLRSAADTKSVPYNLAALKKFLEKN